MHIHLGKGSSENVNAATNTLKKRRNIARVILYTVSVVPEEIRRLVLPKISCSFLISIPKFPEVH
jgi:hypothetical protein